MSARSRWWVGGSLGALLVLAGGAFLGDGERLRSEAVTLATVERGPFVRLARAVGVLEAVQATPVVVPVEAPGMQRIAWTVDDGSFVHQGEVVVRLDPADMERDLADGLDAEASSDLEIRKSKTANETQADNLELDVAQAVREYETAESFASRDPTIFSRHEIIDSEIDRELAAATADSARRRGRVAESQGRTAVELLEIERGKAGLKVRTARQGLGALMVTAPHDGLLVLDRQWGEVIRTGDQVWPGRKLGEIPDPGRMQAKVFVLEADAGGLAPGLPATLTVEAHPERRFEGEVTRVDALAKPRDPGVPVNYFETVVLPAETDTAIMKPGQRVRAEIVLERADDVLTVPRQAIFERDGTSIVYRAHGMRLEPVAVTVGTHNLSRVVVTSGLEPGDRVALRDPGAGSSSHRAVTEERSSTGERP